MEDIEPNELLDLVLQKFNDMVLAPTGHSTGVLCMYFPLLDKNLIVEILNKLAKDGYLSITESSTNNLGTNNFYKLTFEGRMFALSGGYAGQSERDNRSKLKDKRDKDTNTVVQFTIAGTGTIAGYYYMLEVAKDFGILFLLFGILILFVGLENYFRSKYLN